ncbi:MAG: hypothetical protein ACRDTC_17800 [Pseudonocardiaceae bacterium]
MMREDRELLAEMAKLTTDMAPLGMGIIEGSASAAEQENYADRLVAAAERLRRRAAAMSGALRKREVAERNADDEQSVALPSHTVEPDWKP